MSLSFIKLSGSLLRQPSSTRGVAGVELYADWRPREWSEGEDLYIYARRPETATETAERKAAEKQRKQTDEARELELLKQLQTKYAGKV